jgi:hypothetical protein
MCLMEEAALMAFAARSANIAATEVVLIARSVHRKGCWD